MRKKKAEAEQGTQDDAPPTQDGRKAGPSFAGVWSGKEVD